MRPHSYAIERIRDEHPCATETVYDFSQRRYRRTECAICVLLAEIDRLTTPQQMTRCVCCGRASMDERCPECSRQGYEAPQLWEETR